MHVVADLHQVVELDPVFEHGVLQRTPVHAGAVSYTHLRAHETVLDLVCRLLLEKKKKQVETGDLTSALTDSNT